jgi:transposase-like protein
LDELFVTIRGRQPYLWRAVDHDGDVIDMLVQPRRDRRAAERFFRKLLKAQGRTPRRLITDKLRTNQSLSYLSRLRDSDVEVCEIPRSAHFLFYDNPMMTYAAIGEFVNRHSPHAGK